MRRFFLNAYLDSNSTQPPSSNSSNDCDTHVRLNERDIGSTLSLPDEVYHHWCRVLRAKVGEQSVVFDGLGGESIVELESVDKKTATARILSHEPNNRTSDYHSTIAIGMSRGDRMDYAIQKSTELGATTIQLLTSHHGEVRLKASQIEKKLNHWQQIAVSACEQCGLNRPTLVLSPLSIEEWLKGNMGEVHGSVRYLWADEFYQSYLNQQPLPLVLAVPSQEEKALVDATASIKEYFAKAKTEKTQTPRFDILIGAEGGLSEAEYQLARTENHLPWQLGNRVLRTETAPVVALSTLISLSSF